MQESTETMQPTGERFIPEAERHSLNEAEHLARYLWAAQAAKGRRVFDAGCGVGYGTAILARAGASNAAGVDADLEAVEYAREMFGEVADFGIADLLQLPLGANSLDMVTCFEAIEHVTDPERALDEFKRVLREDGLLLVSSPNRGVYPAGNPFHLNEYTSQELESALRSRFANVRMMRQSVHLASVITDDKGLEAEDPEAEVALSARRLVPQSPGEEMIVVGAASEAELPELPPLTMLSGMLTLRTWVDQILMWSERARRAEAELLYARGQLGQAERELELASQELAALRGA